MQQLSVWIGCFLPLFGNVALANTKPNVMIIFIDDFGWADPSCYGNPLVQTPNLDRMAKEGIRFTQGYVASPICSPSRCGILTGQFPGRWKITSYLQTKTGNQACEMVDFLDPKAPTLPRILKEAGYATAHIGKWHLGGGRDVTNAPKFQAYGYDLGVGTWESPEPHPDITSTNWIWAASDKIKRHERTRWMVDQSLEFIKSHPKQPCFINLWLDDTHTPFVPSEEQLQAVQSDKEKPDVSKYKAVLVEMDKQIGRLLDGVKDSNTLVLLLGDNGALPTYDQKRVGGLRGSKLSLYEGGIRVPLLVWWPGKAKAGVVNETTVLSSLDFLPTLAKLCGAALPKDYAADGQEMMAAFQGETPKRTKALFWEYGRNNKSFMYPKEAMHRSPNLAIRDGDWKLLVQADGTAAELYNLAHDPKETKEISKDHPEITKRLQEAVITWRKALP